MYPNRADSFCCSGGGGAMSMAEYAPRRLEVAKVKADQITETGARGVATACHNCVDGLSDLIKHYEINIPVKNVCEYVADAIVMPERVEVPAEPELVEVASGRTILVVDDEPDVVTFLTTFLEDQGFKTVSARDGSAGLALARKHQPDLITLDITLPGRSGVGVYSDLKKDPTLAEIPVFIITGVVEFRQLMYHRDMAAPDGYMEKPINTELLLLQIRRILGMEARVTA
jgi:CheY-like chemotaxis protein